MAYSATGFGPDYEHEVSKARAKTLINGDLPRMGYEVTVKRINHGCFSEWLMLQNISGKYFLASHTNAKDTWERTFGLKP